MKELVSGDKEVIELCRALSKGDFPAAFKVISSLPEGINPEGARLQVFAYFTKVALGAKSPKGARSALAVLEAFQDPYPDTSIGHLVLSTGTALLGD